MHERALRLVYKDNKLTFNDLLELNNSVTIHQRNLPTLATKIFKVKNNLALETMTKVFEIKEPHYICGTCFFFVTQQNKLIRIMVI